MEHLEDMILGLVCDPIINHPAKLSWHMFHPRWLFHGKNSAFHMSIVYK